MKNSVRLRRLKQLKYMLENHHKLFKAVKFNMRVYAISRESGNLVTMSMPKSCNTAACALGSAGLYKPFVKEGLKTIIDERYGGIGGVKYGNETDLEAAEKFFGLRILEARDLFMPGSGFITDPESYPTAKQVAKKVAVLIKEYK